MLRHAASIFIIWATLVTYGYSYDPPTGNPDGVAPPEKPSQTKRIYNSGLVFESVVPGEVHGRHVSLAIKLVCPCPAAYVHFGFPSPGTPVLPTYIYGEAARVLSPDPKGHGTEQEVRLNLKKLFLQQKLQNHTVCFRVELYVPLHERAMCYDGRFTCHEIGERVEILTIAEGPVIDCVTAGSAVVSLDTDQVTEARVCLNGERVVKSSGPGKHHEIEIDGLSPGTTYHYWVVAGKDGVEVTSPRFRFTTAPEGTSSFRFAVMTDSRGSYGGADSDYLGVNFAMVRGLFLDAHRRGASMVFFPGDLVDGFTNSTPDMLQQFQGWRQAVEPIAQLIPVYEGMGNHEMCLDTYDDGSKYGLGFDKEGAESTESLFARSFVNPLNGPEPEREGLPPYRENVYFVDYGQVRFIVLNTNYWISTFPEKYGGNLEGYILPAQMEWLKKCLDDAAGNPLIRHVLVGTHEPVFPTNKHAKDAMWYNGGQAVEGKKRDYVIRCRDRLWQMLVDCPKVAAVICGDEHNYSRLLITATTPVYPDGSANPEFRRPLWLIVTGGAGAPLYPLDVPDVPWKNAIAASCVAYHYVLFTVSPDEISLECVGDNGWVLDSCTIWQARHE